MSRPTTATLSTANLLHNVTTIRAAAPRAKLLAMVKANAYGHGLIQTAQKLAAHVDALGVASIDEALQLRNAGIQSPITLIEGIFEPAELPIAAQQNFTVVFHTRSQLDWLAATKLTSSLSAWLKIDTGMGRLGFLPEDAPAALHALTTSPNIRQPVGLMSHFARADEPAEAQNRDQIACFEKFAAAHNGPKSLCNSAAIFSFPDQHYDWVRPGLALYGGAPVSGHTAAALGLKPVMTLHTRLISVKTLRRGQPVGYGARFICPEDMPIGIMAAGYGDGYSRATRTGAPILIDGIRCQIAGRVSMDMAAIDLRAHPGAKVGSKVILWGEGLPVEEVALHTDSINYDLLTGLQPRAKTIWQD